jgi:uncharacterized membrane protein YjgN (DUF898 family)
MENQTFKKLLKFNGDHSTLVGLRIINNILKVITLGIYYPWGRVSMLKYMYGETEFMGSRFVFHGTGKEMFIGFVKAVALFGGFYAIFLFGFFSQNTMLYILGTIIYVVGLLVLVPLAIHGSYRYRLSRTSWRGIHFGYRGILKEFFIMYLRDMFLTLITLTIYGSWFQVNLNKYIYGHIRFGNIQASYEGKGIDLFIIRIKGFFFSILTLGIYSFWYFKNLIAFEINNLKITQDGKQINLRSTMTAGTLFGLIVTNYLIVIFTLGIGTGIAINRAMRTMLENIEFDDEINPDTLMQTEDEYKNATGDDLAGILDLSVF